MKVAVFIANGSEELEALTPVDVIKRAGANCDIVSVSDKVITGSHDIKIVSDKMVEEIEMTFENFKYTFKYSGKKPFGCEK